MTDEQAERIYYGYEPEDREDYDYEQYRQQWVDEVQSELFARQLGRDQGVNRNEPRRA